MAMRSTIMSASIDLVWIFSEGQLVKQFQRSDIASGFRT